MNSNRLHSGLYPSTKASSHNLTFYLLDMMHRQWANICLLWSYTTKCNFLHQQTMHLTTPHRSVIQLKLKYKRFSASLALEIIASLCLNLSRPFCTRKNSPAALVAAARANGHCHVMLSSQWALTSHFDVVEAHGKTLSWTGTFLSSHVAREGKLQWDILTSRVFVSH